DGLVSQVPAFIVSLAAGLIVTRTSSRGNLGDEMLGQMIAKPQALGIAGVFLFAMAITDLPTFPLLLMGGCCTGLAWVMTRNANATAAAEMKDKQEEAAAAKKEPEKVEKLLDVDTMELEVGYGLV